MGKKKKKKEKKKKKNLKQKTEQWKFRASTKNMKKFGVSGKKKSLEYMEKLRTLCSL